MSSHLVRVRRLEEARRQRPPTSHHTPVMHYPWDMSHNDVPAWLADQPCRCGLVGCSERSIGAVLPTKAPSPEAWEAQVEAWERGRDI